MVEGQAPHKETTELRSLHPKIRSVWRFSSLISGLVLACIFAGAGALFSKAGNFPVGVGAALGAVLGFTCFGLIGMSLVDKQFANWQYQLREYDIVIRKGLYWKSERYIARDRIQHIDINTGPIDRRFGLVQVVIYAAGHSDSVGLIPGLRPDEAEWLRDQLLEGRATDA